MRSQHLIASLSLAALLGLAGVGAARADTFNFSNFPEAAPATAGSNTGTVGNVDTFNSINTSNNTINSDGATVSAAAFSTTATSFNNGLVGGTLGKAFLGDYGTFPGAAQNSGPSPAQSFGLGVSSAYEMSVSGGANAPNHAISNELVPGATGSRVTDAVAFVLPTGLTNPVKIFLNQFCTGNASLVSNQCPSGSPGKDDVSIFIGNFEVGTAASTILADLAKSGNNTLSTFTQLKASDVSSASCDSVPGNAANCGLTGSGNREVDITNQNLSGNVLIVTAALGDLGNTPDYFKIGAVVSQAPHHIPEPGTLAVFGAGLAGLAIVRRRRHRAAAALAMRM